MDMGISLSKRCSLDELINVFCVSLLIIFANVIIRDNDRHYNHPVSIIPFIYHSLNLKASRGMENYIDKYWNTRKIGVQNKKFLPSICTCKVCSRSFIVGVNIFFMRDKILFQCIKSAIKGARPYLHKHFTEVDENVCAGIMNKKLMNIIDHLTDTHFNFMRYCRALQQF